jgi:A/G-specific adenine glycosylase
LYFYQLSILFLFKKHFTHCKFYNLHKMSFSKQLLKWHLSSNDRRLPWKEEKDIYKIWLSELLLQQTRADQAKPFYEKFVSAFPTIKQMAIADEQVIFNIWQGLGYYNRCRNMIATAKFIHFQCNGIFPDNYLDLLKLKGVGPYTAAAIASFAYNEDRAVVDGNVYRVLSRYLNNFLPIDTSEGILFFKNTAQDLLPKGQARSYNQAIMDFGATICTPKLPKCEACPLSKNCLAHAQDTIKELPQKTKKLKIKTRYFHYLVLDDGKHIYLQQRSENDIWPMLWQPFLIESDNEKFQKPAWQHEDPILIFQGKQRLTHQIIHSYFYKAEFTNLKSEALSKVKYDQMNKLSFSKTCLDFFKSKFGFFKN